MIQAESAVEAIVQEISISAPAEKIFTALTNPQELLKWWAVENKFRLIAAETDLHPGGRWFMRVEGSCEAGAKHTVVRGVYQVVEPPSLLVFSWIRDDDEGNETVVRWDLKETGGVTLVRVTHSGFTSESQRDRNSGWPVILSLLQRHLA